MSAQLIEVVTIDDVAGHQFPVAVCATDDVAPGDIYLALLPSGHKLAVYNVNGEFYVTDDTCTHGEASLSEDGMLEGTEVECTWHFGRFDVRTGVACAMPCTHPLRTWGVEVRDGNVWVTGVRPLAGEPK